MSLMPTLLMGICRVSACAWTSSTGCGIGFLAETATFIFLPIVAIKLHMVPKPRNSRILDHSMRVRFWPSLGCRDRQAEIAPQGLGLGPFEALNRQAGLQTRRSMT